MTTFAILGYLFEPYIKIIVLLLGIYLSLFKINNYILDLIIKYIYINEPLTINEFIITIINTLSSMVTAVIFMFILIVYKPFSKLKIK